VPDTVLEQPSVVVARHRIDACFRQQIATQIDTPTAVGHVARAQDGVQPLAMEPFQRARQASMLAMQIANYREPTYHAERLKIFILTILVCCSSTGRESEP
jgi:hypothetical protein